MMSCPDSISRIVIPIIIKKRDRRPAALIGGHALFENTASGGCPAAPDVRSLPQHTAPRSPTHSGGIAQCTQQARLARLAGMNPRDWRRGSGDDLELHRTHRPERLRSTMGISLSSNHRQANCCRPTSYVWNTGPRSAADRTHQPLLLHLLASAKVFPPPTQIASARGSSLRDIGAVHRADTDAERSETALHAPLVLGIGNVTAAKGTNTTSCTPHRNPRPHGICEVRFPCIGRVGSAIIYKCYYSNF